jgi:hypothetical protein
MIISVLHKVKLRLRKISYQVGGAAYLRPHSLDTDFQHHPGSSAEAEV